MFVFAYFLNDPLYHFALPQYDQTTFYEIVRALLSLERLVKLY